MPCQIIEGLISYLGGTQQLNANIWDGEVQRYAPNGQPVTPESLTQWPVVKLTMPPAGFKRRGNIGAAPYKEDGMIYVRAWGTARSDVEGLLNQIEGFMCPASAWDGPNSQIAQFLGGPASNPYYIAKLLWDRWASYQDENVRTDQGELLYIGEIDFDLTIHGATPV